MQLPTGTVWAEPFEEDAIAYMRQLHKDTAFREALGKRAKLMYDSYQMSAQREQWIDELYAFWNTFSSLPKIAGKYSSDAL